MNLEKKQWNSLGLPHVSEKTHVQMLSKARSHGRYCSLQGRSFAVEGHIPLTLGKVSRASHSSGSVVQPIVKITRKVYDDKTGLDQEGSLPPSAVARQETGGVTWTGGEVQGWAEMVSWDHRLDVQWKVPEKPAQGHKSLLVQTMKKLCILVTQLKKCTYCIFAHQTLYIYTVYSTSIHNNLHSYTVSIHLQCRSHFCT